MPEILGRQARSPEADSPHNREAFAPLHRSTTRSYHPPTSIRTQGAERSSMEAGIVGLPNVGKSTLFNALTKAGALAANYPFATIEPNVGVVPIPDPRLE